MSKTVESSGVVLGFGGTNARYGVAEAGEIYQFASIDTPYNPEAFFAWMAEKVLNAAHQGHSWVVSGFPGPVTPDGKLIGPFKNVEGLSEQQYDLVEKLTAADSAVGDIIQEGFSVIAVNDGELAAHAAATRVGLGQYEKTAALILGTGVGAGVVIRDEVRKDVYRAEKSDPYEIGHTPHSDDPTDTYENNFSGPALKERYGKAAEYLPTEHPAWKRVGVAVARMATEVGHMGGAKLVVPTGGVGANASDKYWPKLSEVIEGYRTYGNATQKFFIPEIMQVKFEDRAAFELYGGDGVMKDFQTRSIIDQLG